MPFGSGRKKGWEWTEVSEIDGDDARVRCDHCSEKVSGKIERVRNHLEKCKERKKYKKSELSSRPSSSMSNISLLSTDSDVSISEGLGSSSTPAKKFKAGNLSNFIVRMTTDQKDALDKQVARFFFSNNIPFKSVES
jgi:hypothetical protein